MCGLAGILSMQANKDILSKVSKMTSRLIHRGPDDYGYWCEKNIGMGHCTYLLVNLTQDKYGDPEEITKKIAKEKEVESIDICTGDYELIIKIRNKDIDEYYKFVKMAVKKYGFAKVISLTSLKQVKTEFIEI